MERVDVALKLGARAAEDDEATGCVQVLLRGRSFNVDGVSTLADKDGNRLTDQEFVYMGDSACGLFKVAVKDQGYGYINSKGEMVIRPIYSWAQHFSDGRAWAQRDGILKILCMDGTEIDPESSEIAHCVRVERFHDGLARFSINDFGCILYSGLAYYHEDSTDAGVWGYVDVNGKQIVPPHYIFAEDFSAGYAIVCQGEWKRDSKWDNEYKKNAIWSDEMLWGMIDTSGKEVMPCQFDEIKWRPYDGTCISKKYLAVMKDFKWGLVDYSGNWVVPPQFGDIAYADQSSPNGDMFVFYKRDIWGGGDPDLVPCGIYSISKQKVILPADKYVDIEFDDDNKIMVRETPFGDDIPIEISSLPECDCGVMYEEWQPGMP